MKKSILFTTIGILLFIFLNDSNAQVKVDVKEKVTEEADRRANQRTEEAIDAGFDKLEEGIIKAFKKKEKKESGKNSGTEKEEPEISQGISKSGKSIEQSKASSGNNEPTKLQPQLTWNKYDFVPGEKIIFEDNLEGEKNGEFPSRWDLAGGGSVENALFGEHSVIFMKEAESCIVPFLKDPSKDNLPDLFTIEFDCWFEPDEYCHYKLLFYDIKNQEESPISEFPPLIINANHAGIRRVGEGYYPGFDELGEISKGFWRHVAISFNTRALKVYLDDARVVNIPNLGVNPSGLTICCDEMNSAGATGKNRFIRNIRIAEGAVKLYDKLMQDGKIVTNGIRFDVNKSTLKPESMGIINEIAALMKEHPEIKFSIEGHTDSDGDEAFNQKLSEQRAETVVGTLTKMGIESSRLSSKGWGESKPIDTNGTPEGKANNRRVEFVKM